MNRKSKKILGWCIEIIGVLGVVILLANLLAPTLIKAENLEQSYKERKESCELLKTVANDAIEEEKRINTEKIPDTIKYEIEEKEGKIIFSYNIIDEESEGIEYNAKITLDKDYQIIEEKYEPKLVSYEEYKQGNETTLIFVAYLLAIIIIIIIYAIGLLIYVIISEF